MFCRLVLCLVVSAALPSAVSGAIDLKPLLAPDGLARHAHRQELLKTVGVDELDELRDAVAAIDEPRPPVLETTLRAIVYHAYVRQASLAAQEEIDADVRDGFLGVSSVRRDWQDMPAEFGSDLQPVDGVSGWTPLKGFIASVVFREGDVLYAVAAVRDDGTATALTKLSDFSNMSIIVGGLPSGMKTRFVLQRGSRFVWVDLTLDRRINTVPFLGIAVPAAAAEAEQRWQGDFAPLFAPET